MNIQIKNDDFIIKVLISPQWKIFRHFLLFSLIVSIAAGFIWDMQGRGHITSPFEKYSGLFLFAFLFLGGSYLNIYVLTPQLLLKDKWGKYFGFLLGIVLIIMGSIILIQLVYNKLNEQSEGNPYFVFIVNFLSSTLSIFLLFAGTTTLALFKKWILEMKQSEELESTTLQLELKLLENQINPHFLFNMLNNANIMIKKDPIVASHIIGKLEEILHYQITDSFREKVQLKEDILFLSDFLELEKTRRDYFTYTILEEINFDNVEIAPLLFITFVENAVKHSQDSQKASYVHICFKVVEDKLFFTCENSLPSSRINKNEGGLGLANVKRRLDILYKDRYSLKQTKTETEYAVKLELKL